MEKLLENYSYFKSRSIFIKKEIDKIQSGEISGFIQDFDLVMNMIPDEEERDHKSIGEKISKGKVQLEDLLDELSKIKYLIDAIDTSMQMVMEYNERYKIIIELFYFKKISMDNIAETTHLCRSRCYEICREAVRYIAKIMFGGNEDLLVKKIG